MLPLAERYDLAIAGGDTNSWDGPLAISITLLGAVTPRGPLQRDGAKPGDRILVTGSFGGSILGRHLDFEPRVAEALELHARYDLHAGIDVSDGLSLDLAHVLEESRCGAVIDVDAVPIADDARRLAERLADGSTPLDHALSDGEDFELVLAVPAEEAKRMLQEQPLAVPITDIGEFVGRAGSVADQSKRRPPSAGSTRLATHVSTMTSFVFDAADESATAALGAAIAEVLPPGTTVALCGTLGAGKTRLVQAVAEALGIERRNVVSPTFVLVQEYHGRRDLYHVDAYRLRDEDEFLALGSEEFFESDALVFVEWADRVAGCLPKNRIEIRIEVTGPQSRRFTVVPIGTRNAEVVERLASAFRWPK